jgi:hypothetical protein
VLRSCPVPRKIVNQLRCYPAAQADIAELAKVKHVSVKAAVPVNNPARIAINLRMNLSGACAASARSSGLRRSGRGSAPMRQHSRSATSGAPLRSTESRSLSASQNGIVSPRLPKSRHLLSKHTSSDLLRRDEPTR